MPFVATKPRLARGAMKSEQFFTESTVPQFAANLTLLFNEAPFLNRFEAAAKAGFKGVEFLFPYAFAPEEIAEQLRVHQLENVLFNLPPGDWDAGDRGLASLPDQQEAFRDSVDQALRYAKHFGTRQLHVMAGTLPAGCDTSERALHRATYVSNLRWACEQAAPHGVRLLIEPINTRDMPGYFLNYQSDAHAIREEVGADNLLVQMDLYHAQIMEGDLESKLKRWLPHIGHIQIAGVPLRNEPDTGELNYAYLLRRLDQLGYAGWVGCEYRPATGTLEGLGWMQRF